MTTYGKGIEFVQTRRVTGYLTGDAKKWNNAKQAELRDRIKHTLERTNDK